MTNQKKLHELLIVNVCQSNKSDNQVCIIGMKWWIIIIVLSDTKAGCCYCQKIGIINNTKKLCFVWSHSVLLILFIWQILIFLVIEKFWVKKKYIASIVAPYSVNMRSFGWFLNILEQIQAHFYELESKLRFFKDTPRK